jgi:hypothetical protein
MPAGVSDASVAYASGGGSMSVGDEPPLAVILLLVAIGIATANVRHRLRRIAQ